MSRSGYSEYDGGDAYDDLRAAGWAANVRRCMRGRAGQAFLWELYQSLEALPSKRLIQHSLEARGEYCALGAVALSRGIEIPAELRATDDEADDWDDEGTYEVMGKLLRVKELLAREIMWQNDDCDDVHDVEGPAQAWCSGPSRYDSPEERWQRMREWVVSKLAGTP